MGVSFDSREENAAFAEANGFPFPLLCDTDRKIGLAYGACDSADAGFARRITYVIDLEGRIAQACEKVDAQKHAAELLETL